MLDGGVSGEHGERAGGEKGGVEEESEVVATAVWVVEFWRRVVFVSGRWITELGSDNKSFVSLCRIFVYISVRCATINIVELSY